MEGRRRSDITPKKQNTLDERKKCREANAINVSMDDDDEMDEDDVVFVKEVGAFGIAVRCSRTTVKVKKHSPAKTAVFLIL